MAIADAIAAYHRLRIAVARFQAPPASLETAQWQQVSRQAQRELDIENAILSSEEAQGVVVPPPSVSAAVDEVRQRYEDEAQFIADLDDNGLTPDGLAAALERQLRVESVMERVGARTVAVTELDAQIHFHSHRDRYVLPETRTARHILVTINDDFAENTRDAALKRLQQIRQRLLKKPNRFEEQATKHSECPTAMNGGLLGRVKPGQLYEAVDNALFALPSGGVSEVVESEIGFHLVLCETIHPAGELSEAEALPSVIKHLQSRRQRICQQSWLSRLLQERGLAHPDAA